MSWIDKLDLEKAIKEICEDERQGKDFCIDPLRFEDLTIESVREILVKTAKERIKKGAQVNALIEIDVPKSNYILRPGARPGILDWVVYQAVVNFIGGEIYKLIPDCSYSFNRFREQFKRKRQKRKIEHWLDFENKVLEYSKQYDYMLVTDITSFFENISLNVLRERLLTLRASNDYASGVNYLVENILKPWTTNSKVEDFGLPQGPSASSILADIYLYQVDRDMKINKIVYIRYMDDIRIFTKTKADLKRALICLVRSLRDLKLNLNSKKTDRYHTQDSESLKRVFDPERSKLDLIDRAFKSKKSDQIILVRPLVYELYIKARDEKNPFKERHMKFFISHSIGLMKFGLLPNKSAVKLSTVFINLLEDKPHLTDLICFFLLAVCDYDKSLKAPIKRNLLKFIKDSSRNIYEWQEMWIMDTLRQLGTLTPEESRILKGVGNTHGLCLGQLALMLGQGGNPDDREELLNKIKVGGAQNDEIRYLSLGVQEMHRSVKNQILQKIPEYFREYLERLSNPKYGFIYSLSRIELDTEYSEY